MRILDVVMVGAGSAAGEVAAGQTPQGAGLGLDSVGIAAHAIPPFPTRSEVWLNLFNELGI